MSYANGDNLTSSFPIWMSFIFFCLIALARNFKTMLNKRGKPCHVPDFRGNGFSFFPFSRMLTIGLLYIPFIILRYILSILSFIRACIKKGHWILSKAFSSSVEMIMWFLFLLLLHLVICICWTIPLSLEGNWFDHGLWSFWHVVEFDLPVFYWEFGL
jgi:hypothetical protein